MSSLAVLRERPAGRSIERPRRVRAAAHLPRAGLVRILVRLWWTGWQAHARALRPEDCRR